MKYLVISDIHGEVSFINYINHLADVEQPNQIILLGDMMGYMSDNKELFDLIDRYKDKLILIKGNNDVSYYFNNELKTYYKMLINNKSFVFTHGHLYSSDSFECDVYVCGHSHKGVIQKVDNKIIFNPGSIAYPRGGSINSYGVITDTELILKDLDGNIINKMNY